MAIYKNSTPLTNIGGVPMYMNDFVDACLIGRLNLFLQGDTGSGKTQLAADTMRYFGHTIGNGKFAKDVQEKYGEKLSQKSNSAINASKNFPEDKTLFILGRNDMDTREMFQRINLGRLNQKPTYKLEPLVNPETGEVEYFYPRVNENGIFVYQKLTKEQTNVVRKSLEGTVGTSEDIRELTSKINKNLIVVDELPNTVPAVRAQLFNLFDGCIEIGGEMYSIGNGYSVGIATGNVGQKFTESSNELGRALKDRMHVIIDTDYFSPKPSDTLEILAGSTNPRVEFSEAVENPLDIPKEYEKISTSEIPLEKLIVANYLIHGLDYCNNGQSKRKMKEQWPNAVANHGAGSDESLVLPVSVRAAKSIIRLSQSLDEISRRKGGSPDSRESMLQAYKFVSAYSGILNEAAVQKDYNGDKYSALDAIITTTDAQIQSQAENMAAGIEMIKKGKISEKVLDRFHGRWGFMKNTLEGLLSSQDAGGN